jgi:lysophospholipase L1-like esterase
MSLVPYTITALERDVADADTSGKNIIVGATCSMFIQPANTAALLYDDAAGSNGSTAKVTNASGQVVVFVENGTYIVNVNGVAGVRVDVDQLRADLADASADVKSSGLRQVNVKLDDNINMSDYLTGVGTETTAYNTAMLEASTETNVINIDSSFTVNGTLVDPIITNVITQGNGSVSGPYRKFTTEKWLPTYSPVNTISQKHLTAFSATETPKIVIMGDSIASEGPNSIARTNSMWTAIKSKLSKDNSDKSIDYYNRAIGGQTWLNANGLPTAFPYWYTNQATDWLNYIEALTPDVVFLAFGMNDSNGFNSGGLTSVINKINAFTKVPDIIFITNPTPAQTSIFPDGNGFGFVGETFQEGRDLAAGYARTYADFYGYGLIDINRAMVSMRDCYDPSGGTMVQKESVTASYLNTTNAAIDFAFTCTCDGTAWPLNKVLAIKCGLNANDFIYIKNIGGNFVLEGFSAGVNTYKTITTTVAIPAAVFGLEISILNGVTSLLIDPDNAELIEKRIIAEFKVVRHGGRFLPSITWQGESAGPMTTIVYSSSYGDPQYSQSLLDKEIWGVSTATAETRAIYGGNGVNHYAAYGISRLVNPVLEACNFSADGSATGLQAGGRWAKNKDGTSSFQKVIDFSGNITNAIGSMFYSADFADTDFPPIFLSDGASGFEFSQSVSVTSASGGLGVSSSSTLRNAVRYTLNAATSRTGITAKVHITMAGRWK